MSVIGLGLVACTGTPATPTVEPAPVAATAPAMPATPLAPVDPAPGAPPANAADFEPVSIPLGPREGGGVKWDGVKTKSMQPIDYGDGEVYDPKLATQKDID